MVSESGLDTKDLTEITRAAMGAMGDVMWLFEEERLQEAVTDAPLITIDGETHQRLNQESSRVYHGLWGSHRIEEPLYRRVDVRNGPTVKPLEQVVGIVADSLLPTLAQAAGGLMSVMTSREANQTLRGLGFQPASRAVLEKRVTEVFADMAVTSRELEEQCRADETLDFTPSVVTCGIDRFAVRMDEVMPEGPARTAKLQQREDSRTYKRSPPEPKETHWRMAWAANVTMYDVDGIAQKSYRYGTDAAGNLPNLVARVTDDVLRIVASHEGVKVACIQDGAADLEPLRTELKSRLPKDTPFLSSPIASTRSRISKRS